MFKKDSKKVLLSGVKPSGKLHIGNYFGAIRQFLELQDKYESYVFIADYHAMTTLQNGEQMKQNILDLATDYLALSLDPKKMVLFKQSDLPEVAELGWMFNCITTVPYLMLAHAFKARVASNGVDEFEKAKNKPLDESDDQFDTYKNMVKRVFSEINVGVFDYPLLMAADILIQDADVVPVGKDQKQHVEYARDTAQKFNRQFGSDVFKLPQPLIMKEVETVPGTDGRKMSKSYGNVIPLFATDEEIKKAVMSIPTDSKGVNDPKNPDESHIFAIHKLLLKGPELEALRAKYTNGGMGYKEAKERLISDLQAFIGPLRAKRDYYANNPQKVLKILKKGGKIARKRALAKMKLVHKVTGLGIY